MNNPVSSQRRWYIFAICALMYIISNFWRVSNAVIAGDLSRDLGLTPEFLGLMGGAFFYSFASVQLPMGPMLDRFGPRLIVSLLACIGAASAMAFAFSHHGAMAVLARAGIGIGMAAILMGSYKIFTTWFLPHEFATLSGILISIGNLGAIGATTPLVWLSESMGWRGACVCMAAVTLLSAAAMYLIVRDHPPGQTGMASAPPLSMADIFSGIRTVFGTGLFWRLSPLAFASYGALITAQGLWGGPYLTDVQGLSKTAASGILLAIPMGIICGAPWWGRLSDRMGRRKGPILVGQIAMLAVYASFAVNLHLPHWGLALQCWLLGFTGTASFVLYAQVKETFPIAIAGTALTAQNFFVVMGAAVFQHMMGVIMNHWEPSTTGALPAVAYQWGFGASAFLLALALTWYAGSRDTAPGSP